MIDQFYWVWSYLCRLAPASLHLLNLLDLIEWRLDGGRTYCLLRPIVNQLVQFICECAFPRWAVICGKMKWSMIALIDDLLHVSFLHFMDGSIYKRTNWIHLLHIRAGKVWNNIFVNMYFLLQFLISRKP